MRLCICMCMCVGLKRSRWDCCSLVCCLHRKAKVSKLLEHPDVQLLPRACADCPGRSKIPQLLAICILSWSARGRWCIDCFADLWYMISELCFVQNLSTVSATQIEWHLRMLRSLLLDYHSKEQFPTLISDCRLTWYPAQRRDCSSCPVQRPRDARTRVHTPRSLIHQSQHLVNRKLISILAVESVLQGEGDDVVRRENFRPVTTFRERSPQVICPHRKWPCESIDMSMFSLLRWRRKSRDIDSQAENQMFLY